MSAAWVWAILVGVILVLIIYGMVSSKRRERRAQRLARQFLPEVGDYLTTERRYRVVLTSGTVFEDVRFVGIGPTHESLGQYLPFPLQQWLVLEKADGKRLFVKPAAVKLYEEL